MRRWQENPHLEILGNPRARRLSIVSFRIRHGSRYPHHNFVVAVLNDLFGIQARGGCSCAEPYGHRLLAIDTEHSLALLDEILHGCDGIKPGGFGSTSTTSSPTRYATISLTPSICLLRKGTGC